MKILKKEFGNIFKTYHERYTQIWVPKGVSELDDLVIKLAIRLADLDFIKYVRICDQYFFSLQLVKEIISTVGGSHVILGINSHIKSRLFRGFFYVKKFKNSAPKINQKPVQNSEFDIFGFF